MTGNRQVIGHADADVGFLALDHPRPRTDYSDTTGSSPRRLRADSNLRRASLFEVYSHAGQPALQSCIIFLPIRGGAAVLLRSVRSGPHGCTPCLGQTIRQSVSAAARTVYIRRLTRAVQCRWEEGHHCLKKVATPQAYGATSLGERSSKLD